MHAPGGSHRLLVVLQRITTPEGVILRECLFRWFEMQLLHDVIASIVFEYMTGSHLVHCEQPWLLARLPAHSTASG